MFLTRPISHFARDSRGSKIVKHFVFDLTCDVTGDLENFEIRFLATNFPGHSNGVCIL